MTLLESPTELQLCLRRYPGDRPALTLVVRLADRSLWLDGRQLAGHSLDAALNNAGA